MEWKNIFLKDLIYKPISGEWGKEVINQNDENIVKVIRTANFTNGGVINYNDIVSRNIDAKKVEQKKLIYGDILVEKSGGTDKYPVGRVVFYDKCEDTYLSNNFITVFRAKEDIVYNKFLFYFLMFNYNKEGMVKYYNKTTGIQNLRVNNLIQELQIPVPTLDIQKQIVEVLDKSQNLIDSRKKQIELLDSLIESIFYDMFGDPVLNDRGWEVKKLENFGKWGSGGTPSRKNKDFFKGEINWFSAGELNHRYIYESNEKITQEAIDSSSAKLFKKGTLLIGMYDTAAFKLSILSKDSSSNQACANLECNKNYNIEWIYDLFKIMRPIYLQSRTGVRQKNLSQNTIKNFMSISPPLPLQNQFAQKVQKIEYQKQLLEKSLKLLENNYNNLMQRAFKGELF